MTPVAAAGAIQAAIATAWTSTPIAWPNVPFQPPEIGSWLKVDFIWGAGDRWTKEGLSAITGIVQLAIFGQRDIGDGALDTLAETARAILNRNRLDDAIIFGVVSGPVRQMEESWRSVIVSCPFKVLETV